MSKSGWFTISQKASDGDILDVSALLQQDCITLRNAICPVSSPLPYLSKPLTADVCIGNGPLLRTRTVADVAFCCRSFKVGWLKPENSSICHNHHNQNWIPRVKKQDKSWQIWKNMTCSFRSFEANGRWCSAHRALQGGLRCLWEARKSLLDDWMTLMIPKMTLESLKIIQKTSIK